MTLGSWVNHDDHQRVIHDLDQFRTRPWYYVIKTGSDLNKPENQKDWNKVPLDHEE